MLCPKNVQVYSKENRKQTIEINITRIPTVIAKQQQKKTICLELIGNPEAGHFEMPTPKNIISQLENEKRSDIPLQSETRSIFTSMY